MDSSCNMRGTMTTRRRSSNNRLPLFPTTSSPSDESTTTVTTTSPIINGSSGGSNILLMPSSNNRSNNSNKMRSINNSENGSTTTSRRQKRRRQRRLLFWGFRLGSNFNGWRGGVGGLLLVALLVLLICFLVSSSLLVLLEESSSNGEAAAPPPFLPSSLRHDHGGSQPQQQQEDVVERQQQQTRQLATDDDDEFDDQEIQQDDDDDGIMSGDDGSMDDAVDDDYGRRGIIKQQQSQQQQHWTHRIPNVLTFTHRYNLLQPLEPQLSNANLTRDEMDELYVLQTNVQNIIEMHNNNTSNAATKTKIEFWTDDDCIRALELYDHDLAQYFQNENVGMYKADICRGIALYKHGGLYFDVDLGVRMLLWDVLKQKTEFVTIRVHHYSKYKNKGFFQAFIGCVPKHPVIKRYLDLFLDYYRGKRNVVEGPLGVLLLKQAYDDVQKEQVEEELQKQQRGLDNDDNDNTQRKTKTTINTHLNKTTELWQEVLYVPQLQKTVFRNIPPPTWGTRRACKFVVLSSPALPVSVPFYSRIANSRMCPAAAGS